MVPAWIAMPWTPRVIAKPSMTRSRLTLGLEHRGRQPGIQHHRPLALQPSAPPSPLRSRGKISCVVRGE